uniref:Uncharacterized protein n=1 Tax=Strongyloides stercoralis TaxID=6248 RepID=A0A0K0E1B9_STRER
MITRAQSKTNLTINLCDQIKQLTCDVKKWKGLYSELEKNYEELESDFKEKERQLIEKSNEIKNEKKITKKLQEEKNCLEEVIIRLNNTVTNNEEEIEILKQEIEVLRLRRYEEKENINVEKNIKEEKNLAEELKLLDVAEPLLCSTPKKNKVKIINQKIVFKIILYLILNKVDVFILLDVDSKVVKYAARKNNLMFEGYEKFESYRKNIFMAVTTLHKVVQNIKEPENVILKIYTNVDELTNINSKSENFKKMKQLVEKIEEIFQLFISYEILFNLKDDYVSFFKETPKICDFIKY